MRRATIIIAILLGSLACFAQKDYQHGYIINSDGDTIRGLIEYKNWYKNPNTIFFKQDASVERKEYHPFDIKAFFVKDELYKSAVIDLNISPHKIADLDANPLPVYRRDTVFLQTLLDGSKSLYHFRDKNANSHFYIYENGFEYLVYKQYLTTVVKFNNAEKKIGENLKYKGQLIFYLRDCHNIESKMNSVKYQANMLANIFNYYYRCTNKSTNYSNDFREGLSTFGIVTGISLTSVDMGYKTGISSLPLSKSTSPTIGFYYDFELARTRGLMLINELVYSNLKTEGEYNKGGSGTVASTVKGSFEYHYLKTNHMIRYSVLRGGILFISGGVSTGVVLRKSFSVKEEYSTGLISSREFKPKNYEIGYIAGLGSHFGRFTIEARYSKSYAITDYSATQRFDVLLKYQILKFSR
ncbi:hypothetical protein [Chryseolinea sp. H1M3-3]|uniref:outer membrane beta-barrel protein n=1 Tax=Chryseolinea sp. H1M3-3 TaxID=3034144 RepID=UPI0023ECFB9F|nr:hypothetical protein [Chryseolinea sp. H1M3-3]